MWEIEEIYKEMSHYLNNDVMNRIYIFKPKNYNEFSKIKGIGEKSLIEIWHLIDELETKIASDNLTEVKKDIKTNLEKMSDKLENFSSTNKSIWISRSIKSKTIDVWNFEEKTIKDLMKLFQNGINYNRKIELNLKTEALTTRKKDDIDDLVDIKEDVKRRAYFSPLLQNVKKIQDEKGQNSLYLSSMIFNGKARLKSKEMNVRAPIFYFPIKILRNEGNDKWILTLDGDRDIFTNGFILKYIFKISDFEYDGNKTPYENIEILISNSKIKEVETTFENISKFSNVKNNSDWMGKKTKFEITDSFLIGIFSDFSSYIQAEINDYVETEKIPNALNDFLLESTANSDSEIREIRESVSGEINDFKKLNYTNNLNAQQLKAIKTISNKNSKGLVIWGPPGTGKSETIISLIENEVAKGKRVLVVSEKQAAIEVIKNRLNSLKDSSIIISDERDKKSFYEQLKKIINKEYYNDSKTKIDFNNIEKILKNIESIYYKNNDNKNILEASKELFNERNNIDSNILSDIENETPLLSFDVIIDSKEKLDWLIEDEITKEVMEKILFNYYNNSDYPSLVEKNKSDIKDIQNSLKNIKSFREEFETNISKFNSYSFFKRRKLIFELSNKYNEIENIKKIFKNGNIEYIETLYLSFEGKLQKIKNDFNEIKENKNRYIKIFGLNRKIIEAIHIFYEKYELIEIFNALKFDLSLKYINSFDVELENIENYDSYILEYNEFLENFKSYSSEKINEKLFEKLNKILNTDNLYSILKMVDRKRPMAIRKFIRDNSAIIRNLVPIWLMRTDTVPVILDKHEIFDLVIFDEASQIFLENSLPAIARSKKVVILGDEKQLGPSNFFLGRDDDDDDFSEAGESLLKFAKTKYQQIMLKNHYRSNSIELIDFSNDKYYSDELNFIDNGIFIEKRPIEYIHVENAIYSEGTNEKEIDEIISILQKLKKNNFDGTLGIIATNKKQIKFLLGKLIYENEKIYEWLSLRNVFYKSIEEVQGDERDIIIFSTTFGMDSKGTQKINFGPISGELGSNRINVAVTRARNKMFVVSSINLEQASVKISNSKNDGPKDFIDYIKYARDISNGIKNSNKVKSINLEFDSIFEEEFYNNVISEVRELNLDIQTQYESLGFKIDMVVFDKKTERKILAVELDGATFHSSFSAIENDINRQKLLEARGWEFYRVWSTNWWQDKNSEIEKFLKVLKRKIEK